MSGGLNVKTKKKSKFKAIQELFRRQDGYNIMPSFLLPVSISSLETCSKTDTEEPGADSEHAVWRCLESKWWMDRHILKVYSDGVFFIAEQWGTAVWTLVLQLINNPTVFVVRGRGDLCHSACGKDALGTVLQTQPVMPGCASPPRRASQSFANWYPWNHPCRVLQQ